MYVYIQYMSEYIFVYVCVCYIVRTYYNIYLYIIINYMQYISNYIVCLYINIIMSCTVCMYACIIFSAFQIILYNIVYYVCMMCVIYYVRDILVYIVNVRHFILQICV